MDVISIFAVEEHPGGASYNYLAVTSAVDFSVKFISSELLQFFFTLPVYVHSIYNHSKSMLHRYESCSSAEAYLRAYSRSWTAHLDCWPRRWTGPNIYIYIYWCRFGCGALIGSLKAGVSKHSGGAVPQRIELTSRRIYLPQDDVLLLMYERKACSEVGIATYIKARFSSLQLCQTSIPHTEDQGAKFAIFKTVLILLPMRKLSLTETRFLKAGSVLSPRR